MINVAQIGVGYWGPNLLRNLVSNNDCDVRLVIDTAKERRDYVNSLYPHIRVTGNVQDIEDEPTIDAVVIATPAKTHYELVIRMIKAGKHVLVEKPIAATLEEAKEIINDADKNNVNLMVGHIERFNPVVMELKRRIAGNELGKIYKVNCMRLSPFPKRVVDVGVIVDLAVHEIDILRYIIDSKIIRVYAETAQRVHSKHEDLLIGTVRFENKVLGVINANWLTPKKVREITVTGEKGMFAANYLTQELCFYENDFTKKHLDYNSNFMNVVEGNMEKIKIDKKEPLKLELESFIDCIKKGTEPIVTGQDGIEALKIAEKFRQSAKENKVMVL